MNIAEIQNALRKFVAAYNAFLIDSEDMIEAQQAETDLQNAIGAEVTITPLLVYPNTHKARHHCVGVQIGSMRWTLAS